MKRLLHIFSILMVLLLFTDCSHKASRKGRGGEVKPKSERVSRKQQASMPSQSASGFIKEQQLRLWEYRIHYYKKRSKEAKKLKEYDRQELYDFNKEKYQRLRRQETTLLQRIVRNLNTDFRE